MNFVLAPFGLKSVFNHRSNDNYTISVIFVCRLRELDGADSGADVWSTQAPRRDFTVGVLQ
jgi:hypothetical protein